jgi:hypothetical protein
MVEKTRTNDFTGLGNAVESGFTGRPLCDTKEKRAAAVSIVSKINHNINAIIFTGE